MSTTITKSTAVTAGQTLTTNGLFISDAAGNGALTVSGPGANVTNTGTFVVGNGGFGSLLIAAGGVVLTSGGETDIGGGGGSDGSNVSVNGKASSWQIGGALDVGHGGAGSLSISAGATVTAGQTDIGMLAGGSGIVSVVGNGSSLAAGSMLVVGDADSAELSILNGATVSATDATIGVGINATGNVDIEGTGSHLMLSHDLNIGAAGVGVLTLGNGTELTVVNNLNIGANGVLNSFGGIIDPAVVNNTGRTGGKGQISASVSIVNSGTLFAQNGTETLIAPIITGKGVLEVDPNGNLALNVGSVVATQSVVFTDATGILTIGTLAGFSAVIQNFNAGDHIIVEGVPVVSTSYDTSSHVLTLLDSSNAPVGTLQFGTSVPSVPADAVRCFAAGTRISTSRGDVAVEALRVGDVVQVLHGRHSEPVTWIGHRTVDCTRHPRPHLVWPVRIAAHAFGPGRPCRDLYVSPDHAIYVSDVLIPAKYLVNGQSIVQVECDEVTYYHVELSRHAVLLAEALPAESYLDDGDRANFANHDGPVTLHPDFASRIWEAEGCAPLVVTGPVLEAARRWVNSVALAA